MSRYVTIDDFDDYVVNEFGSVETTIRQGALDAAERMVDEHCARSFDVAGASATARTYIPSGSAIVRIHDCTTVTAISLDGAAIPSTDYQLEPVTVSWSGLQRPYEQVRYLYGRWVGATPGKAALSVTATWGWTAIPDEVLEAVKIAGKDILAQRRTVGNMATIGDFGGTVRLNTYVRQLLGPLRRAEVIGIA